jgi:hypothetical protein
VVVCQQANICRAVTCSSSTSSTSSVFAPTLQTVTQLEKLRMQQLEKPRMHGRALAYPRNILNLLHLTTFCGTSQPYTDISALPS